MKFCPKCKTEHESNIMFCPQCGSKLVEKIKQSYCVYCGKRIDSINEYCSFCGNRLLKFNKRKKISSLKVCNHCNGKYHYDFRFCPVCGCKMTEIKSSFFKFASLLVAYLMVFIIIFSISFANFENKSDIYPAIFKTLKLEKLSEGDKFWSELALGKDFNQYKRSDKEIFDLYISTFINGYKYVSAVDKTDSVLLVGLYNDKKLLSLSEESVLSAYKFLQDKAILIENNSPYIHYCYAGAALASINLLYFLLSFSLVTCIWYVLFYKLNIDWGEL